LELLEDQQNIAEGLAYASYAFNSLGKPSHKVVESKSPIQILEEVRKDKILDNLFTGESNFKEKISKIEKECKPILEKYDIYVDDASDEKDLSNFFMKTAVEGFLLTGALDFFLLHGVTSTRALKTVLHHLKDRKTKFEAFRFLWRGLVATYITQGRPELKQLEHFESKSISWDEIISKTLESDDVHLIKLVFVCHAESVEGKEQEKGDKGSIFKETAYKTLNTYLSHNQHWHYL